MKCVILSLVLATTACGSSSDQKSQSPPGFEAEAPTSGARVSLRAVEVTQKKLVLEVVGDELDNVYGVAFRLKLDTAIVELEKMEAGSVWTKSSGAISRAKLGNPKTLVGVLTQKGAQPGFEAKGTVLATLRFNRKSSTGLSLNFSQVHSAVVAADGRPIDGVRFAGGKLQ